MKVNFNSQYLPFTFPLQFSFPLTDCNHPDVCSLTSKSFSIFWKMYCPIGVLVMKITVPSTMLFVICIRRKKLIEFTQLFLAKGTKVHFDKLI